MKSYIKLCLTLLVTLTPIFSFAQDSFIISEIMMNPEGSDSGREWIEVVNLGAGTGVDGYKFKEGSTSTNAVSHGLKIVDGQSQSWLIDKDEAFVIADNPEKFFVDYPDYSGNIFDSSFSLTNSGEYLAFLDASKNILFEISVTEHLIPDEGNGLCLVENIWNQCNPSPGVLNTESDVVSGIVVGDDAGAEGTSEEDSTQSNSTSNPNQGSDQPVVQQTYIEIKNPDYREKVIKADGGGDRVILAGSEFLFEAKSYGLLGNPLRDPKYRWNFGDGKTEKGERALHVYHHPGEYTATLSAKTERFTHVDRFKIKVIEPDVKIIDASLDKEYIKIKNETKHNLDISYFWLKSGSVYFEIPENTYIDSGAELIFPKEYTEILLNKEERIKLQTPNRKNIDVYEFVDNSQLEDASLKPEEVAETHPVLSVKPLMLPKKNNVEEVVKNIPSTGEGNKEEVVKEKEGAEPVSENKAQVLTSAKKVDFIGTYLYEIIFGFLMTTMVSSVFFIKPKKSKEDHEVDFEKEAKSYEINERD